MTNTELYTRLSNIITDFKVATDQVAQFPFCNDQAEIDHLSDQVDERLEDILTKLEDLRLDINP